MTHESSGSDGPAAVSPEPDEDIRPAGVVLPGAGTVQPALSAAAPPDSLRQTRSERLAAQLKANLKRRKAQQRARAQAPDEDRG
ncbi:hypothetical protein E8L99_07195 [Phreatobacter aquaticus]|uniref:Uncharacterized protein n=1 Tax=Phreatobacter aquaticus TaxID=2570229 RepID=A0A4D7QEI0_9HYPH|nr:hypothetical protein [Phreatobacter aquaticus]QCK85568.1 hypothetical protein E8L99_07195 [Phreatobacter aquaticus]